MLNPAISAVISGGLMYYLGVNYGKPNQITKIQQKVEQVLEPIKQIFKADTFSSSTVKSITRSFEMNPRCFIHYSTLHRTPLAVHELLDKTMLVGDAKRDSSFHIDPVLSKNQEDIPFLVTDDYYKDTQAYRKFDYNRGHMAAAGNYSSNQSYKSSTFTFANTIPQDAENNGGIWNTFERYSRSLLERDVCDTLQVISGPVYHSNSPHPSKQKQVYQNKQTVLKENGIIVPPKLYKIIKCNKGSQSYASGYVFPNSKTTDKDKDNEKSLDTFKTQLNDIELMTGLHFSFKGKTKTLAEIDIQGLQKTKRNYDQQFFNYIFSSSEDIGRMSSNLWRARGQKIHIDPKDYKQRIEYLSKKQVSEIRNDSELDVCQKLNKYMSLYKNLKNLQGLDSPIVEDIQQSTYESILPCRYSDNPNGIKSIIRRLKMNKRKNQFPHEQFLKKVMSTYKQPVQQQTQQQQN